MKSNIKRFLALALAVFMVVGMMPMNALAAENDPTYVAQIGETKYESLTEALNACTNGETVQLIADITYTEDDVVSAHGGGTGFGKHDASNPSIVYIGGTKGATDAQNQPSNVNAVLDLNGHTITNSADAYLFLIMDNAKLTFKDSVGTGSITNTTEAPVIWAVGTDTLVTIESGKYTTAYSQGLIWSTHGGDLVITGGEFKTTADDSSLLIVRNEKDLNNPNYFCDGNATITVTGGTFDYNPKVTSDDSTDPFTKFNACAEGYYAIDNGNGTWTVTNQVLATLTFEGWGGTVEVDYPSDQADTLQGLADYYLIINSIIGSDDTPVITLYSDVTGMIYTGLDSYGNDIYEGANWTLELNGHTLNGAVDVDSDSTLTVQDSVGGGKLGGVGIIAGIDNYGTVTVKSGTVYGQEYGIYNNGEAIANVEGGVITSDAVFSDLNATIWNEDGVVNVTGGKILATDDTPYAIYNENGTVAVSGGEVYTEDEDGVGIANGENGTAVLSGGTFDKDYTTGYTNVTIAEGYASVDNGNGTWTVVLAPKTYVAEINGVQYTSVYDAVEAAQDGDTITVIADHEVDCSQVTNMNEEQNTSVLWYIDNDITLDLNGKTVTVTNTIPTNGTILAGIVYAANGADVVVTGNGAIWQNDSDGWADLFFAANGSTLTVENGTYTCDPDEGVLSNYMLYAAGGLLTIEGGTYTHTTPGYKYIFNVKNGTQDIVITGGTFTKDPALESEVTIPEGYKSVDNGNGTWTVRKANYVAQVGETKYESLQDALNACTNGETVQLIADITYTENDVVSAHGGGTGFGKYDAYNPAIIYTGGTKGTTDAENQPSNVNAVLDLNGHTITNNADAYLFLIMDNAELTFKDSVGTGSITNNKEAPVIWAVGTDTLVTIESGKYTTASVTGLIWSTHGGDLVITGGEFKTTADDSSLLIVRNEKDLNNPNYFCDGNATITVTGGTFDYNPEVTSDDNSNPYTEFNACAEGYYAIDNGNGTWTVTDDYVKWIKAELLAGRDVKLAKDIVLDDYSYVESIPAKSNGNGKHGVSDGNGAIFNVIGKDVTFDLNGHSITLKAHDEYFCNKRTVSLFYVTDGATLTVTGEGNVNVYGMATAVYSVAVESKAILEGGTWNGYACETETCGAYNAFLYAGHGGEINVTAGTYNQVNGDSLLFVHGNTGNETTTSAGVNFSLSKMVITGGTFNMDPEKALFYDNTNGMGKINVVAEGYVSVDNGNGTWTVKEQTLGTITIDGVWYENWDVAKVNIKKNSVIVFYADQINTYNGGSVAKDYKFPTNAGTITIDLNGHNFTSAKSSSSAITTMTVQSNTTVKFTDSVGGGKVVFQNNSYPFVMAKNAKIVMAEGIQFVGSLQCNGGGDFYVGEKALIGANGVYQISGTTRVAFAENGDWTVSIGTLTMTADDDTLKNNTLTINKNCTVNRNGHTLTAAQIVENGNLV